MLTLWALPAVTGLGAAEECCEEAMLARLVWLVLGVIVGVAAGVLSVLLLVWVEPLRGATGGPR